MAIVSKIITDTGTLADMLDAAFNTAVADRFWAWSAIDSVRGSSPTGNLYADATPGTGNASVALTSNVVITVDAASTSSNAVSKIVYGKYVSESSEYYIYTITLSPAEEFQYQGTITITSATITLSGTMT